ncbi:MAG: hypothetical protein H7228_04145 [Polaromonas sp.]|nr:hypothetical protein [Polaromonas sp.]
MTLDLDKRQRAMLREMGVRVWQPAADAVPELVAVQSATELIAVSPIKSGAGSTFNAKIPVKAAPVASRPPQVAPSALPAQLKTESTPASRADTGLAAWSLGEAQALYAETTKDGARWLVLAEAPVSALQAQSFNPFEGDAGKLLDNMLRAARLDKAGAVLLAPLVRRSAADAAAIDALKALPDLIASAKPDVVLVMGRLAAQALLQSAEPFGKLRGQVHELHGVKTIVTHDAANLLRRPLDKAMAWDDLCLAMSVA